MDRSLFSVYLECGLLGLHVTATKKLTFYCYYQQPLPRFVSKVRRPSISVCVFLWLSSSHSRCLFQILNMSSNHIHLCYFCFRLISANIFCITIPFALNTRPFGWWWWSGVVVWPRSTKVNLRRARLVLGWVTVFGYNSRCGAFISLCNQPPRSTQSQSFPAYSY